MSVDPRALPARLWDYQRERLPLVKTALLTLAFSAASVTASAAMAERAPPGALAYAAAFAIAFVVMLELRVLDEFKDSELDRAHRPERPVPRGLVSLSELAGIGIVAAILAIAVAALLSPWLLLPLAGLAAFIAAMSAHFGLREAMHRSPALTLLSHMLVMPVMDFAVTACEWLPRGAAPPSALWIFLALSFANGCVLEIGRKTWAAENERAHVESYSSAWGVRRAMTAWLGFLELAAILILLLAYVMSAPLMIALAGPMLAFAAWEGARFLREPTPARQQKLDTASGLWIFASYLIAGFGPFLSRWITS